MENMRLKVMYYGRYTHYGGCLVFLCACITFIVEFARLSHIARYHKHDASWVAEGDPNPTTPELNKFSKLIEQDPENERAVQMGNKESLIFVYYLNCATCILFAIIGLVMYFSSKPTLQMCNYLQLGVESVPEELAHTTRIDQYLEQRKKFRYAIFMTLVCFILILLSSFIRLTITIDTIEKENKLAEQQEKNGDEVESFSNSAEGGTSDDPDPDEYAREHPDKLRVQKYENAQFIWFATNSQGEMPLLFVPFLFIGLVTVLSMCNYYFYKFQYYQEELAAAIDDNQEKGGKVVMEQDA